MNLNECIPLFRDGYAMRYSRDAHGHEHKGKGPGGGQFTTQALGSDAASRPVKTAHTPIHDTHSSALGTAAIVKKTTTTGTNNQSVNQSFFVDLADGHRGVFKPASGETPNIRADIEAGTYWRREIACFEIAQLIGIEHLVPETVQRTDADDGIGSIQAFCDDASVSHALPRRQAFDGPADSAHAIVFDFVCGNTDRHRGNWMITSSGRLKLIDNGLTFPVRHGKQTLAGMGAMHNRLSDYYHDLDLSAAIVSWKGKLPEIIQRLQHVGIEQSAIDRLEKRFAILMHSKTYADAFQSLAREQEAEDSP